MQFQADLVDLRIELLQTHAQLLQTCNTFRTCPPPAIATALALTNGQEISRCGQILSQASHKFKSFFLSVIKFFFNEDRYCHHCVCQN